MFFSHDCPGHTRYSTQGESDVVNIQPFVVETIHGLIAVAHNGELINAKELKKKVRCVLKDNWVGTV